MTYFPQAHPRKRASRIDLGPVPAIVVQEDGQHTTCKLQTVSVTGGLLRLGVPITVGHFVELAFQAQSATVHGMAEMLKPTPAADDTVQPFRFIALDDNDHRALTMMAEVAAVKKPSRSLSSRLSSAKFSS